MSSAASLGVDAFDVDDAERVTRHDTSLVKRETEFALSLGLIHEAFRDVVTIIDQSVRSVLNLLLLLARQALIVCDVEMSFPIGLLGTGLPDVGSEDLAARGENNVRSSVMSLELEASLSIDRAIDCLSNGFKVVGEFCVELMEDAFTDLDAINHVVDNIDAFDAKCSDVVGLSTRGWVEAALIENDQVPLVLLLDVGEDGDALRSEVHHAIVIKIDTSRFRQVDRIVENCLWLLHNLLLSRGNLVVEVAWGGLA